MDNKSEEKWARLEEIGFEHYEISNHANIRDYFTKQYPKELYICKATKGHKHVSYLLFRPGTESKLKRRKFFLRSRLVAKYFIPNPKNLSTVDHINRIRDDDRVENLRWATRKQQNLNQGCHNKTGMKYVTQLSSGRWESRLWNPELGKKETVGTYATKEEAGKAVNKRAMEIHIDNVEFLVLNS